MSTEQQKKPEVRAVEHKPESKEEPAKPEAQAITPGTAVAASATIDSLFTSLFATRGGVATGTATYSWGTPNTLIGVYSDSSMVFARFEARPFAPTVIAQ